MKNILLIGVGVAILLVGGVWWSKSLSSSDPNLVSATGLHWHPQIEIYIKGERKQIPANVGIGAVHNPLHTHADMPIIHMEFDGKVTLDDTRLGNFFDVWGKEFNADQIFEYQNGPDGMLRMFVNGAENTEFENYHMRDGDRIEIRYE